MSFLSPIVVSDRIYPLASNTALQVDPTQLLNPNRTAMLIDQFRFTPSGDVSVLATAQEVLWQMSVSIQLGSIPLTKGLVPLAAMCPSYDYNWFGYGNADIDITTRVGPGIPQYVWHLPKPMYVPPNVVTYVNAQRSIPPNDTGTGTQSFRVAVVGRSLPSDYPVPKNIYVPWCSAATVFDTTNITTLAGVQTFVTPDNALGNPHNTGLMMTRLLGFHSTLSSSGVSTGDVEAGPNGTAVSMTISNGKILVRRGTPFFHLFPSTRGFVDMRGVLRGSDEVEGGEFVKARLDYTVSTTNTDDAGSLPITILGLVGYRSVPTPRGV